MLPELVTTDLFDSSLFSSLTFEWKCWETVGALLTWGPCFPSQIDQDGLTLPERTLYLAQDEESEKVSRHRLELQGRKETQKGGSQGWVSPSP